MNGQQSSTKPGSKAGVILFSRGGRLSLLAFRGFRSRKGPGFAWIALYGNQRVRLTGQNLGQPPRSQKRAVLNCNKKRRRGGHLAATETANVAPRIFARSPLVLCSRSIHLRRARLRTFEGFEEHAVQLECYAFTNRVKPPEISVATLTTTMGKAIPPGEARYFGRHVGWNFSLYSRRP